MKEIIPKETRLSPIIYTFESWRLCHAWLPGPLVFVRMSLIREDHTIPLAACWIYYSVLKFSWKKPILGENIGESDEKSTYDQFRIITTAVSPLSPVWCKYEENCLTCDIYTRILIGHITSISKLSGFLPLLIFILVDTSLYHFTNYCEGPLHAALRNFMWSHKMADCSWLSDPIHFILYYTMGQ